MGCQPKKSKKFAASPHDLRQTLCAPPRRERRAAHTFKMRVDTIRMDEAEHVKSPAAAGRAYTISYKTERNGLQRFAEFF
jgi:hypothetical protein